MPTLNFETHEVEAIERRVSRANNDLPWKLNAERCQVTTGDHVLIYAFSLDFGDRVYMEAQSNGGSIGKLYGFSMRGENAAELVRTLYDMQVAKANHV